MVLARLVMVAASLIALLISLAIVLYDVNAGAEIAIAKGIHEGANVFAGAFTGLIRINGHAKWAITVDWGIALVAYLVLAEIVSRIIFDFGRGATAFGRRHRTAATDH